MTMSSMDYPISSNSDGVNIRPELMEKEKLYYCIFKDKIILVFKDIQDNLNCYEIEESDLVNKIKNSKNGDESERIFEDYVTSKPQKLNKSQDDFI